MKYLVYTISTGEIDRQIDCPENLIGLQLQPGEAWIEGEVAWGLDYIQGGQRRQYTPTQAAAKAARPAYPSTWDNTTFSWSDPRTLAERRATKWESMKAARVTAIDAPLSTPYGTFDCDPDSRKNITDSVLMLQTLDALGTTTTIEFTLANNATATLSTAQMVEVGLLLGAKIQAAHATARTLRLQIEAATTGAAIDAIVWPS